MKGQVGEIILGNYGKAKNDPHEYQVNLVFYQQTLITGTAQFENVPSAHNHLLRLRTRQS